MHFQGMKVIESVWATQPGEPKTVQRTWKERLLTWPWRPWITTKVVPTHIPAAYRVGNMWVVHPTIMNELRRLEQVR